MILRIGWITLSLAILSFVNESENTLVGFYRWDMDRQSKPMLIKMENTDENRKFNHIIFNSSKKFEDKRNPNRCGNDIIYHKTGVYSLKKNKLTLNYTGGNFSDNVGGEKVQVYVKGKVIYRISDKKGDTIFLVHISGNSTKIVPRKLTN